MIEKIHGDKYMSIWKKIDFNPEEIEGDIYMKISKQHFELIADTLATHAIEFRELEHEELYDRLVSTYCYALSKENPAFDEDEFRERCRG
jgi:hypothetical protein